MNRVTDEIIIDNEEKHILLILFIHLGIVYFNLGDVVFL